MKTNAQWKGICHLLALILVGFAVGGLTATPVVAQDAGESNGAVSEDEWYDPTDWFDGNNVETEDLNEDDYWNNNEYEYNDEYGYNDEDGYDTYDNDDNYGNDWYDGYWDNYYTYDWWDDEGDFDDWYATY